jgi:hypothetical protein
VCYAAVDHHVYPLHRFRAQVGQDQNLIVNHSSIPYRFRFHWMISFICCCPYCSRNVSYGCRINILWHLFDICSTPGSLRQSVACRITSTRHSGFTLIVISSWHSSLLAHSISSRDAIEQQKHDYPSSKRIRVSMLQVCRYHLHLKSNKLDASHPFRKRKMVNQNKNHRPFAHALNTFYIALRWG